MVVDIEFDGEQLITVSDVEDKLERLKTERDEAQTELHALRERVKVLEVAGARALAMNDKEGDKQLYEAIAAAPRT